MWKIFLLNAKTQVILIANLPELYCIYCPFHQTFNEKYIIYVGKLQNFHNFDDPILIGLLECIERLVSV